MILSESGTRVFILASTLVTGGAERVVESLALGLAGSGYDPEVLCLHSPGRTGERLISSGVRVTHGLLGSKYDLSAVLRLSRAFSNHRGGILLSLDHHDAIALGIMAAGAARLQRRVLSVHSTGLWEKGSSFTAVDRVFLRGFGRIVALARMHRDHLVRNENLEADKIVVINNGVDTERFAPPDDSERRNARAGLGLGRESFVVSIVAALRPEKNHRMFLEAASILKRKKEGRYVFLIAGTGTEERSLREIARSMELGDTVRFLGAREDVETVLKGTDASVLCSLPVVETFPLAVLEGMATGIPVISTGVGSVPEMIDDGVDGMIIESGNAEGLAASIEFLEKDPARSAEMGNRARRKVEDRYSLSGMVCSYVRLFDDMREAKMKSEKQ